MLYIKYHIIERLKLTPASVKNVNEYRSVPGVMWIKFKIQNKCDDERFLKLLTTECNNSITIVTCFLEILDYLFGNDICSFLEFVLGQNVTLQEKSLFLLSWLVDNFNTFQIDFALLKHVLFNSVAMILACSLTHAFSTWGHSLEAFSLILSLGFFTMEMDLCKTLKMNPLRTSLTFFSENPLA